MRGGPQTSTTKPWRAYRVLAAAVVERNATNRALLDKVLTAGVSPDIGA